MKRIIESKKIRSAGPYSTMVAAGGFLYISGQIPMDHQTNQTITDDIRKAARQVMENLRTLLKEVGLEVKDIIKTTLFVANLEDIVEIDSVYKSYFAGDYPARSCLQVMSLPQHAPLMIEAVAVMR